MDYYPGPAGRYFTKNQKTGYQKSPIRRPFSVSARSYTILQDLTCGRHLGPTDEPDVHVHLQNRLLAARQRH